MKYLRRCAVVIIIGCAAFPLLVQSGSSNLPAHGGGGGNSFSLDCGDAGVLVGVSGRSGQWLDRLQARCTKISTQGNWVGDVFTTESAGGTSGTSFTRNCPVNTVVKGISGRFGWYVHRLSLRCEPLGSSGSTSTINAAGSQSGDQSFNLESCANGRPARGFHGKAGGYIDSAGLICHTGSTPTRQIVDPCKSTMDEIKNLKAELRTKKSDFQEQGRKPNAAQIRKLESEYRVLIAAKEREYDGCRLKNGGLPDQPATLDGTATMTTSNQNAAGPFVQNLQLALTFLKFDHTTLEVNNFPAITAGPFNTPVGPNTTTVSLRQVQSTSVNPNTGEIRITLQLSFVHSLQAAGNSDLTIQLSTENTGGSRINRNNRRVTIAGTGTFEGGFLNGNTCTLVISGTLSALP